MHASPAAIPPSLLGSVLPSTPWSGSSGDVQPSEACGTVRPSVSRSWTEDCSGFWLWFLWLGWCIDYFAWLYTYVIFTYIIYFSGISFFSRSTASSATPVWKFQCTPLRSSGRQTLEPGRCGAVHMLLTAATSSIISWCGRCKKPPKL